MSLDPIAALLSAGIGYLVGSLSFGYWVAKAHGVDIFAVGSRSPGATNVKRSVGKTAGNLVFALDFVKGLLATGWPLIVYSGSEYPVGYGLNPEAFASTYGAFYSDDSTYLHATGFLLEPKGLVDISAYSCGAIGRLTADDALQILE